MDSAVTYIDQALAAFEEEFGVDLIHEKFPQYIEMKKSLQEMGAVMSQSRGDRNIRDALYANINDNVIPMLIEHHNNLETSTNVFEAVYRNRIKGERKEGWRFWAGWVLAAFGLIGTAVGAVAAIKAIPATPPPAASTPSKPG